MGRKKKGRDERRKKERRTRERENRRGDRKDDDEQRIHGSALTSTSGVPDASLPDVSIPDATAPSAAPAGMGQFDPSQQSIARSTHRPLEQRGYDPEAQEHIHRATKDTGTDPADVPDQVLDVLGSGSGQSLDSSIQNALEQRMDADFSNVQIHTGAKAAEAADAIDAKAFTCGNAIVFNQGEYDPESAEGQHLLAHELAHVKQQTGAAISMMPQSDTDLKIDPDPQLEREAEQAAEEALSGEELLIVNRLGTSVHVQRTGQWENQIRRTNGTFGELVEERRQTAPDEAAEKPYANCRPKYAAGQVETVWEQAKDEEGNVYDPNTGEKLEWDRSKPRAGQWDMGHKPDREYRHLHSAYMNGRIPKEQFLAEYRDPDNYRPEKPPENRSGKYEGTDREHGE